MTLSSIVNRLTILPRWIIIFIDLLVIAVATILGFLFRFNFHLDEILRFHPVSGIALLMATGFVSTLVTRSYAGIVRYTGVEDGIRIMYASLLSVGLACCVNLLYFYNAGRNLIPYSVLLISFFTSFLFLFYYRLLVKTIFTFYKGEILRKSNVAIFGAGSLGMVTRNVIEADGRSNIKVVAFLEDDQRKVNKVINGIEIYSTEELSKVVRKLAIKEVIIAVRELSLPRKNELVETCFNQNVRVRIVPPAEKWVKGEFRLQQIKEVNIEDLLGREIIRLEENQLFGELTQKVICVTGAAGSIGAELCRQLLNYKPKRLILIDQAESPLHEIQRELDLEDNRAEVCVYVADITHEGRINTIFAEEKPELVFHAAAYKHVPMMESNPSEAIVTNILGTKTLADLSIAHGVRKFVMVSTDKAVNPTSVMGCSKRIAEIYVQSLYEKNRLIDGQTSFVTTRFGNVLGSNGSVIPIFRKQIQGGGPVTVTHPEITRYFMTIPEACRLVLEAGTMGQGGEIYIFDMGQPVKMVDLAKKMIRLSGLEPYQDIDIIFTGLREGEKLHEELLNSEEDTIPTHHKMILKAKVREYDYTYVQNMIELFIDLIHDRNELKMVALMKEIVPEYKSNYSRYEVLDDNKSEDY